MRARARPPACTRTHTTHRERDTLSLAPTPECEKPRNIFFGHFQVPARPFHLVFFLAGGRNRERRGWGWWQAHGRVNVRVRVCSLSTTCHCPPPTPPPKRTKTTLCAILRSGRSSRSQPLLRTTPGGGSRFKVFFFFLTPSTERAPVLSRSTKWVNNNN